MNYKASYTFQYMKRITTLLLCFLLLTAFFTPFTAIAEGEGKTVRVGWHEAPYFYVDQFGRRFGYSYEYQQKIAAYTGWNYEYVEGNWSDLLKMLKDGEIDMLANVSYTDERAEDYLFTSLPMGTEVYHVFVSPGNTDINIKDYASLNGKKIGVAKGSIQNSLLHQWAEEHNISADITEMTSTEAESLHMLGDGLDAFVTMDVNADPKTAVPLWKIGSSDYYFAVSKAQPDLLDTLNDAMSRIQDENINYSRQLSKKYFKTSESNMYLTEKELAWLSDHGKIRVGYQDNYLAFCAQDASTGKLTGALKDYLDYASNAFENTNLDFETVVYPTASAALEALKNGEIDCMFPANLIASDAELMDFVMTPALMKTEMDAVVRESDKKEFIRKDKVIVAVNQGNTNYEMFLKDHFPDWEIKYFPDTPTGLTDIAAGGADCVIISNYRFNNIAKQCEKLKLTTVYTGVDMDYYLAVRRGDTELYSILSKMTVIVPDSIIHAALTYYSTEDAKTGFIDYIKDHLGAVLLSLLSLVLLILGLLLRSIRAEKRAIEEAHTISNLNKRVYFDALTKVRNKGAFDEYTGNIQKQIEQGEKPEAALGMFDCDNLKTINDKHGHDKGDLYLQATSRLICGIFKHSPVFRIGGDEFAVVLQGEDYENRYTLMNLFQEKQDSLAASEEDVWEKVCVSTGIAAYDPETDTSFNDVIIRADKLMYENKRIRKENQQSIF
ncbi:MAG: transporter substrate-binding domain-containing protein [Clostridia bacterium]|nr:transporter substrate-binding domain-containing protein [Clostridia bacterium]